MRVNRLKQFRSVRMQAVAVTTSIIVTWVTPAGELPDASSEIAYSQGLSATASDASAVTYSVVSGALPAGLSLSGAGQITGTATQTGVFTFTVRAAVGIATAERTFSIEAFAAPVWITPQGTLGSVSQDEAFDYTLQAQ